MYHGDKVIALCISKAGSERNFEFIKALNDACAGKGFRLFIYHTCSDLYWGTRSEEGEKAVFSLIDFSVVDIVMIFEEAFHDKTAVDRVAALAAGRQVPVVSVGAVRENGISFLFDYAAGFEKIVRHVIEDHGLRDTCFFAGRKGDPHSDQRIGAYKKVLAENGIEFAPERLFYGDYWWRPTQNAVRAMVESGIVPQAVICVNDMTAITVCEELKKYEYAVPGDIAVTGFDGTWEAMSCVPPITTCKCDLELTAKHMIGVMEGMLAGETADPVHYVDYAVEIYRSCGCDKEPPLINVGERLKKAEDKFNGYQNDERLFYEMQEKIIESDSMAHFVKYLHNLNFENTCIIVNNDCFDESVNPSVRRKEKYFDESVQVLYATDSELSGFPAPLRYDGLLTYLDHLTSPYRPLIFSTLSYLGIPMGVICFGFRVDIECYCKILQYVMTLNTAIGNYRLIRYLEYVATSVENMSKQDFMTGLYNRKGFYKELPGLVENAGDKNILVASVDLDGLKNINDRFGHEDGDFAIKAVADAVKQIPFPEKICGRFGGDELVVCAVTEESDAERLLIDSVEHYLSKRNQESGKPFLISASVGVRMFGGGNLDFETALKLSDEKMYQVKKNRPNRRNGSDQ